MGMDGKFGAARAPKFGATGTLETQDAGDLQPAPVEDFSPILDDDESLMEWSETESARVKSPIWVTLATIILVLAIIGWTSTFIIGVLPVAFDGVDKALLGQWMAMISAYAPPVAVMLILLLFIRRYAKADVSRVEATLSQLQLAEAKLSETLNRTEERLAESRAQLTQLTHEFAVLGDDASARLVQSSAQIQSAFDHSQSAVTEMKMVGDAALSNMERFRGQLPIITNSTRDLTNAIADAGGGAAHQVRDLSALMTEIQAQNEKLGAAALTMADQGNAALSDTAQKLDALNAQWSLALAARSAQSNDVLAQIDGRIEQAGTNLIAHLAEADVRVSALMQSAQDAARNVQQLVADSTSHTTQATRKMLSEVEAVMADMTTRLDQFVGSQGATAKAQADDLAANLLSMGEHIDDALTAAASKQQEQVANATRAIADTQALLQNCGGNLESMTAAQQKAVEDHIASLHHGIETLSHARQIEATAVSDLMESLNSHMVAAQGRVDQLASSGAEQSARLAFAFEASSETYARLQDMLAANEAQIEGLIAQSANLQASVGQTSDTLADTLPGNLQRFAERLTDVRDSIAEQSGRTRDLENQGERLIVQFRKLDRLIVEQSTALEQLNTTGGQGLQERMAEGLALAETLQSIRQDLQSLEEQQFAEIGNVAAQIKAKTKQDIADIHAQIAAMDLAPNFAAGLDAVDSRALVQAKVDALADQFSTQIDTVENASQAAFARMEHRLSQLSQMTDALEQRFAQTEQHFDAPDEEGFARRMALLTESLNNAAIDVAKILSNEVTDTAWQHYLKGDRGVFTRRAVRLLNQQESRVIARQYDEDGEFRAQVNRYIHDFESMMRVLLSTRDGHIISVTLLSSDVGKLYVALAQAIERLRG